MKKFDTTKKRIMADNLNLADLKPYLTIENLNKLFLTHTAYSLEIQDLSKNTVMIEFRPSGLIINKILDKKELLNIIKQSDDLKDLVCAILKLM